MSWTKLATTPELIVYRDDHGNPRLRSTITGRFLPMTYQPDYGMGGYGESVTLPLNVS
jgi:hypothetical protein